MFFLCQIVMEVWQNVDALIFRAYQLLVTCFGELNWMLDFRSIRKPFSNLSCDSSPFLFRLLLLAGAFLRQLPLFSRPQGKTQQAARWARGLRRCPWPCSWGRAEPRHEGHCRLPLGLCSLQGSLKSRPSPYFLFTD